MKTTFLEVACGFQAPFVWFSAVFQ